MITKVRKSRKKIRQPHNRVFMGLPVEEATEPLYVQPNKKDIEDATVGDPENCMYARCLKRVYESTHVVIYGMIAYVQLYNEDGKRVYRRYQLSKAMIEKREQFDMGKKIAVHGISLRPSDPVRTLDARVKEYHRRKEAGYVHPKRDPAKAGTGKTPSSQLTLETRSGHGMVKFFNRRDNKKVTTKYAKAAAV